MRRECPGLSNPTIAHPSRASTDPRHHPVDTAVNFIVAVVPTEPLITSPHTAKRSDLSRIYSKTRAVQSSVSPVSA
jgi:hypothetical protein